MQWLFPQQLASQAVIRCENPRISMKTQEKLCPVMDDVEFTHKLQESPDQQLHQQLTTLPKQKPAPQRPIPQGGYTPCIRATCGAREREQKCDKGANVLCRIFLFLIFFF